MSLHINNLIGFGAGGPSAVGAVYQAIVNRGLTSNLKLCLDAGSANSYPGSGTKWLDLSGNGYDFDFEAAANDPSFSGVAGADTASEYMLFDTNDWFDYDTTVETWMSNLHKDNALFSLIAGVWLNGASDVCILLDTSDAVNHNGVQVGVSSTGTKFFADIRNNTGSARTVTSSATPTGSGAWNFVGMAIDEAGNTASVKLNGTTDTAVACSYTTPGTAAANPMRLGSTISGTGSSNNTRLAFLAVWEGVALTSTNLNNLYSDIAAARSYGF